MRVEDEDVDLIKALEGLHGCAARVARGGAHDGGAGTARFQHVVHEPTEQLHGHVLERERRAVEKLEHEQVVAELGQWAHGRVTEGGVGLVDHPAQCSLRNVAVDQRSEHGFRHLGIGLAGKATDRLGRQGRPAFRQIEPAVPGEAGQQGVSETERRGFSPGRDMEQCRSPGNSAGH
ncbi:MAG: hypothetical protein K0S42_3549 [Microvirga sp.]|nr:hypothetical protein [Microvirga sp.]